MKSFQIFSELESRLDIGDHCVKEGRQSEALYCKLCSDWVDMFSTSVNITNDATSTLAERDEAVSKGWVLTKPRAYSSRFTEKIKTTSQTDLTLVSRPDVKLTLHCPYENLL